ncbi:hypothetical protein AMS68_004482 [Peltaster fructicola]|uniref:3-hydroxyisobutyrate dehydrogenase n=1 Tax=Peltaster fructicola TaxID=286661 RepID=A0A6H0XWD1_9PEZI|nr:hypothetical protein AMS68_004482 [Peltaster fructicola]
MLLTSISLGALIAYAHAAERPLSPRDAGSLQLSTNVLTLRKSSLTPGSSAALQNHLASNGTAPLITTAYGSGYAATVTFEGTDLLLLVDTGSSDTWIASKDFNCVNRRGIEFSQSYCSFGPLFIGTFAAGPIPDQNFNVSYGSGEFVVGETGLMNISIAGIAIAQQEIALIDSAYWLGDNTTTGIVGLAYEALTSSYKGDDPTQDNPDSDLVEYSPIVQTALDRSLFSVFSMALERGNDTVGGYLALGGLPPVDFNHTFVSATVEMTNLATVGRAGVAYSYYTIRPNGFSLSGGLLDRLRLPFWKAFSATTFPVIVDSGTTLNYLPYSLAQRINALYDPPARFNSYVGVFETECDAKAPDLSVRINGTDFVMNKLDLIITTEAGQDPDTGLCITAIQPSNGPYILGDVFLKNVVAVFDVGDTLIIHDVNAAATEQFIKELGNVTAARDVREVAEKSEIIVTALPEPQHVRQVFQKILEPATLLESPAVKQKRLFIDTSTIDPDTSAEVAESARSSGLGDFIDAPMSGGVVGASAGTLTFMIGAPDELVGRAENVLKLMGRRVVHLGPQTSGLKGKLANNYLLALNNVATCEAMNMGVKWGLDPKKLADMINTATGKCWPSEINNPVPGVIENSPASRGYDGGFGTSLMLKDLKLALLAATKADVVPQLGAYAKEIYTAVEADEKCKGKDFSVVYRYIGGRE